jgi:hypothetical protein
MTTTIPSWNTLGLLPPIDDNSPTSFHRSPYSVSLKDVVMRFATSPERQAILRGFLNYRQALHQMGLQSGFQWLDGSFMENVEILEKRHPRDIDVVTFLNTPEKFEPSDDDLQIFDKTFTKTNFKVDAFTVELDEISPAQLVEQSAYWYSVWSHRRNKVWKGFLQIDLNSHEDAAALSLLENADVTGTQL